MKPPQHPPRSSYLINNQRDRDRDSDYQQTPKTITSEYRIDKSKGKNTIFQR